MDRSVATVFNKPMQIRTDPHQPRKREAKDQISRSDLPPKLHFRYSWRTVGLFMRRADDQDEIIRSKGMPLSRQPNSPLGDMNYPSCISIRSISGSGCIESVEHLSKHAQHNNGDPYGPNFTDSSQSLHDHLVADHSF